MSDIYAKNEYLKQAEKRRLKNEKRAVREQKSRGLSGVEQGKNAVAALKNSAIAVLFANIFALLIGNKIAAKKNDPNRPFSPPLFTLVAMQLKQKLNLKHLNSPFRVIFGLIFAAAKFAVITIALNFVISLSVQFSILSLVKGSFPIGALTLGFAVILIASIISVTTQLTDTLYLSGDNALLLTYPVNADMVFVSKLIVFYINELKKNLNTMLPLFVAYAMYVSANPVIYAFLLLWYPIVSLIPVIFGAILSIPFLFFRMRMRENRIVQIVMAAAGIFAVVWVIFSIARAIPPGFDLVVGFGKYSMAITDTINRLVYFDKYKPLTFFTEGRGLFQPFRWICEGIGGRYVGGEMVQVGAWSWQSPLWFFGILATAGTALYFAERVFFFKMASKPMEFKARKRDVDKPNRKAIPFFSSLKKETLAVLRSPEKFFSTYLTVFALPFIIYLLNKMFLNMDTDIMGEGMVKAVNVLILALVALTNNTHLASILSSEGQAAYILKSNPQSRWSLILSKAAIPMLMSLLSVTASIIVMGYFAKMGRSEIAFTAITIFLLIFGHAAQSAESDILKPQYKKYFGGAFDGINPNEAKSTGIAFALAIVFGALSAYFIILDLHSNPLTPWLKLAGLALIYCTLRIYLFISRTRVYYEDF
ncbi:MAG: hypothetical protein LBN25_03405 [Christensenellaceae bacterium]|jgi:hypothetical protein|nr:hypothetical protein [Christensenellaceae bacterium]